MKKAIIGAGGFAREIRAHMNDDGILMFVDDIYHDGKNKYIKKLSDLNVEEYEVIVGIGDPLLRAGIVSRLPQNTKFFSFIHPSALILDNDIFIGEGSIICANVILTTNIAIGEHAHLNLKTTIGHDCIIGGYFTTAPGASISGNCNIGNNVYIGTNASIKEKINICSNVTIGLNAGVVKNIEKSGTYIGTPAKRIE